MSQDLNSVMEFDHVIRIDADGTVNSHPEPHVYAPESVIMTDEDGQISADDEKEWRDSLERQGWDVLTGWSGQYGYAGPIMHASEYVGGALADYILETPGLYAVIAVECLGPDEDSDSEESAGWAVAYRTED